jgi:hypothetical protein
VAGVLLLAGCSDEDDPPSTEASPSSTTSTSAVESSVDTTTDDTVAPADDTVSLRASDPDGSLPLPDHTTEQLVALTPDASDLPGTWTATDDGGTYDVPYPVPGCDDDPSGWPAVQGARQYTDAAGRVVLVLLMDVRPGEGADAFAHYEQQYGCDALAGVAHTPVAFAQHGDGTVAVLQPAIPDVPESVLVLTRYGDLLELIAASGPTGDHLALAEQVQAIAEAALQPGISG